MRGCIVLLLGTARGRRGVFALNIDGDEATACSIGTTGDGL